MSIDSLTSTSSSRGAHFQQIRQDLGALQSDLKSGNLTQAQTDFATLLNDAPRLKNALSSSTASTDAASSLAALSSALQSGDTNGATTALGSLQQAMGSIRHHHHHHHHDGDGDSGGAGNSALSSAAQADIQTLSGALQAGNLSAAQQAMAQLQQDDPALALGGTSSGGTSAATLG